MSQSQPPKTTRKRGPTQAQLRARKVSVLLAVIALLLALVVSLVPRVLREQSSPAEERPAEGRPAEGRRPADIGAGSTQEAVPQGSTSSDESQVAESGQTGPALTEPVFLTIIIDDVGYDLAELEPFLALPGPIIFAVLPGLPNSRAAAELIHQAGKSVIVHMPMEPAGGQDPGPGAILVRHDDREIERRLEEGFASVPQAIGLNNHMGSRAVSDPRVMNVVMSFLAERDLVFVDSRTTADSVAFRMADLHNVPFAERSVFLDNENAEELVETQLQEGLTIAAAQGQAVLIGHVQSAATARVLERRLPGLANQGFLLAPLPVRID